MAYLFLSLNGPEALKGEHAYALERTWHFGLCPCYNLFITID